MPSFPVGFKDFVKNPIAAVSFCLLIAVGYLYYDNQKAHNVAMDACEGREKLQNERIGKLESDYERLSDKFVELATDLR